MGKTAADDHILGTKCLSVRCSSNDFGQKLEINVYEVRRGLKHVLRWRKVRPPKQMPKFARCDRQKAEQLAKQFCEQYGYLYLPWVRHNMEYHQSIQILLGNSNESR